MSNIQKDVGNRRLRALAGEHVVCKVVVLSTVLSKTETCNPPISKCSNLRCRNLLHSCYSVCQYLLHVMYSDSITT